MQDRPLSHHGFLWQLFSGWDMQVGYQKHDIIKKMIKKI